MRRPSHPTPPRAIAPAAPVWPFLALVTALPTIGFSFHPLAGTAILAFHGLQALLSRLDAPRCNRIAAARRGENICTFTRALDLRRLDPWVVRAVYEELQAATAFPLRPTDTLTRDLRLDEGDLHLEMIPNIARRIGRSLDDGGNDLGTGPIETISDLIEFLDARPQLG
ncbi:MAG: hypothetical protein R3D85_17360 [Paracoccaceae bacterium]